MKTMQKLNGKLILLCTYLIVHVHVVDTGYGLGKLGELKKPTADVRSPPHRDVPDVYSARNPVRWYALCSD